MDLMSFEDKDLDSKNCDNFLVFLDKTFSRHSTDVETMAAVFNIHFSLIRFIMLGCYGNARTTWGRSRY